MIKHADVVIIGGGISGLASAWWLSRRGIKSVVLEQADKTGGLIDTTNADGYITDHAASMILNFNSSVSEFIVESGLQKHQIFRNKINKRYIYKNNGLTAVPETIRGLMASDLFSLKTRLKLMTEPFRTRSQSDAETVADFIRRRVGQEILDLAIDPYVSAVLACDPEKACARSTLPRLTALEQTFGSFTLGILAKKLLPGKKGIPQEAFAFRAGMKTLVDVLAKNPYADIHTSQPVTAIEPIKSGWRVFSNNNDIEHQHHARQVIFSTPANIASRLLKPVQAELSELLGRIEYAPIAQIHLGFERTAFSKGLDGSGFLVPSKAGIPLRGSLWTSNLLPNRAPENKILTSNYIGGACQPDALKKTDAALTDDTLNALQHLCGLRQVPEMVRINRHAQGLPLYHGKYYHLTEAVNHYARLSNGLHFVSSFLQGISIRDRIIQARTVAEQINTDLSNSRSSSCSSLSPRHELGYL